MPQPTQQRYWVVDRCSARDDRVEDLFNGTEEADIADCSQFPIHDSDDNDRLLVPIPANGTVHRSNAVRDPARNAHTFHPTSAANAAIYVSYRPPAIVVEDNSDSEVERMQHTQEDDDAPARSSSPEYWARANALSPELSQGYPWLPQYRSRAESHADREIFVTNRRNRLAARRSRQAAENAIVVSDVLDLLAADGRITVSPEARSYIRREGPSMTAHELQEWISDVARGRECRYDPSI